MFLNFLFFPYFSPCPHPSPRKKTRRQSGFFFPTNPPGVPSVSRLTQSRCRCGNSEARGEGKKAPLAPSPFSGSRKPPLLLPVKKILEPEKKAYLPPFPPNLKQRRLLKPPPLPVKKILGPRKKCLPPPLPSKSQAKTTFETFHPPCKKKSSARKKIFSSPPFLFCRFIP